MEQRIQEAANLIIDRYVHAEDLNELMKAFVQNKAGEGSKWSAMTDTVRRMMGGAADEAETSGAIVEMLVLALDIMDDLQDLDNMGKPWMTCPREFAMNAVMSLMMCAYAEIGRLQQGGGLRAAMTEEVSRLIACAVNGQQQDLNGSVQTEEDYFRVVQEKSGSLMRIAFYMGYVFADGLDEADLTRLNDLAECRAIMAQMDNDLHDALRFDVKNDLLNRQRTFPVLFLLEHSETDFPPLKRYYDGEISREEFVRHKQECISYVNDSGCVEYVKVVQALYRRRAEELLEAVAGVPEWKEKLRELVIG